MSLRLVDGVSSSLLSESTLIAMLLKTIGGSFGRLVCCLVSRRILKLRKTTTATRSTTSEADTESDIINAPSFVEMDPTVESKTKRLTFTAELIYAFFFKMKFENSNKKNFQQYESKLRFLLITAT